MSFSQESIMEEKPLFMKKRRSNQPDKFLVIKSIFYIWGRSKIVPIFAVAIAIVAVMVFAILVVTFTASKRRQTCEFTYRRPMKSSLITSSQPQFVISGDVNNDQQIDIVVTNFGTNTIGIFMGQGNGTFAQQRTYPADVDSHPSSVTINDFNNDSYADIVVANYDTNSIGLLFGYGNGTFSDQEQISLDFSRPLFVTSCDFDQDNQMDLAVVNNGTNTISILLGYGNGSFQNSMNYFTGYDSLPCSLAIGDLNNDTHLDMVVANSGTDNIGIFLNYGNGTFTNQYIYLTPVGSKPASIALGDFDNDNMLDIVVANYGSGSVSIFFNHGHGHFLSQVPYIIGPHAYPQYVTINDINQLNVLDIIIVDSRRDHIHVLPGYGDGRFGTVATYDTVFESRPVWITVDDFNNNSKADVIVVNQNTNNIVVLMDYFAKPSTRQRNYDVADLPMLTSVAINDFNHDGIFDIVFNPANYIAVFMGNGNSTFGQQRNYFLGNESNPQYICTGDLNNDKQIDIIIADTGLDGVDVLLGYKNGTFGDTKSYSTGIGSSPWWAALGDFDEDHVLDIVSANHGTYSIGILRGNGDGSFTLTINYTIDSGPLSVAVGDINNDNHSDFVVATDSGTVDIYIGQGNSTFIMSMYFAASDKISISISLGNFNNDNYLDIVVANSFTNNISVVLGYGDGTFAPQTTYFTGLRSQPWYVIVADCNNDKISDIVTTNFGTNEVLIFYGYGNGSFHLSRNYSTGSDSKPFGIVTRDLNNDTHLEFIVALYGTGDIAILTEYNAAEFASKTVYTTGAAPQPTSLAVADFNNDNQSDIVVADSGRDSLGIILTLNKTTFDMEMIYPIGTDSSPQYVITCDINKDNHMDIVSVNSKNDSISLIMGYGNGSFAEQIMYPTGVKSFPSGVVVGDINNDNRLDLIIANKGINSIGILYGYDYTSFQTQEAYFSSDNLTPRAITISDFNNDHILDIAATFSDSDSWCIYFGYGNASFTNASSYSLPKGSKPWGIGVGDFNNDNQSDIVIANSGTDNIGVLFGHGNGRFTNITLYSTGNNSLPQGVAVGGFNNDSQSDIVVANYGANNIGIFLGFENGSFGSMVTYSTGEGSHPYAVTVGDFNNDGRLDIAVANYEGGNAGVLLGYGNGTFANQMTFSSGYATTPIWISVSDFNRDNQTDIATANFNGQNVGILLGHGNGSFDPVVTYTVGDGSEPFCIGIGDFNSDKILDIVVAKSGADNIVVLFGLGDGSFLLGSAYSTGTGSRPFALVIEDFNKDGRLDVVVANWQSSTVGILLGTGDTHPFAGVTKYPIDDGSQSQSIALGDFNNDTWLDIVVANFGTNSIGILLGRSHGKFSELKSYSTGRDSGPYFVVVAHLNNDTYLDIVVSNSKIDNIIIFLGDGTGEFINGDTYSTGTRSRPYQITIEDFNNDNVSDIAVANSGTNNILLLYGYGNGTFGNQTSHPFGYGYQPYSIAAVDLNKDHLMDFVIGCYGTNHIEILINRC